MTEALVSLRRVFYALGAFSFVINVLLLVPAVYMLQMYDRVLSSRNEGTLIFLTVLMVGLIALEAALEFVRSRVLVRTGANLDMQLDGRIFDAAFARNLSGKEGHAGQALSDLSSLRQFLTGKGLLAFFDAPWTPLYLLVIVLLSPVLGLFALVAVLLLFMLAWWNERTTAEITRHANALSGAAAQTASSSLRNSEVIGAMGMLDALRQRWFERQQAYLAAQGLSAERAALIGGATRFFRLVLQSGILGLGAYLVLKNELTPGGMIAGSILLGRALAPVDLAISTWRQFVSARLAYRRINALLEEFPVIDTTVSLPRPRGQVSVENLLLASPGSHEAILKGISFSVPAGALVGVVGASASGKSTLARALVGIWKPMSGCVRLDGADVSTWNRSELGPWLGYLPQDIELFEGTIAENIARFGPVDSACLIQAAQRAGVHEMILRLPQGYETSIGPRGTVLSGGQRQRIGLARALYGDPVLVVLDEPNANLDEAGDQALLAALRLMKTEKRTVFVMTHRVNVLDTVDAVLVLSQGKIKAFGPKDDILKAAMKPTPPAVIPAKKSTRARRKALPPAEEVNPRSDAASKEDST